MPITAALGPSCVKTRTLFFKVEFWPRLGGNSSQEIFRHHREGTTKENDSQQVSRRSVFTQPGPQPDIASIFFFSPAALRLCWHCQRKAARWGLACGSSA